MSFLISIYTCHIYVIGIIKPRDRFQSVMGISIHDKHILQVKLGKKFKIKYLATNQPIIDKNIILDKISKR